VEPWDFAETLRAAQRGDQQGYAGLWRTFSPRIAGFLRGRGVVDIDAVTSHVFCDAFGSLDTFTGNENAFAAFLFTIARRRAVDVHRRRARQPQETLTWDTEHGDRTDRTELSAEDTVMLAEDHRWALSVLATLSEDQREVLLLRIVGDLTVEAVANELGKTPGAVKALQRRGLDTLRRTALAEQADNEGGKEAP
jgi:RNA polymerase sigma-70 factor (ECF subfamily)